MESDPNQSSENSVNKKKGKPEFRFNPLKNVFLKKSNFKKLVQKLKKQRARINSAANKLAEDIKEKEQSLKLEFKPLRRKKSKSSHKKKKIARMLSGKMNQLINSLKHSNSQSGESDKPT